MFSNFLSEKRQVGVTAVLLAAALLLFTAESKADSGFYIGGSAGTAGVEVEVDPILGATFDEDDFAWKALIGYHFDLPIISLGIEAAHVDLGGSAADILGSQFELDVDGLSAFGVVGVDLGPLGIFGKYGIIDWDAEISIDGIPDSDDGSDPAYGVGAKLGFGSLDVRLEYEIFDIDNSEDVSMISLGLTWTF